MNSPMIFNQESNNKIKDIFRVTKYNQRKFQRLLHWRDKKYMKYHNHLNTYDATMKRLNN